MKKRLLKDLYGSFYIPSEFSVQKLGIVECHQALIEVMDKLERRLMLQIIDAKDYIIENIFIDSFFSGFGWLENQGEGIVIYDHVMHRNGNKAGIMGSSE